MDNKNDDFNTLFSNLYESKKNASNLEKIENSDINKKSDLKVDEETAKKSDENQDKKKNIILISAIAGILLLLTGVGTFFGVKAIANKNNSTSLISKDGAAKNSYFSHGDLTILVSCVTI